MPIKVKNDSVWLDLSSQKYLNSIKEPICVRGSYWWELPHKVVPQCPLGKWQWAWSGQSCAGARWQRKEEQLGCGRVVRRPRPRGTRHTTSLETQERATRVTNNNNHSFKRQERVCKPWSLLLVYIEKKNKFVDNCSLATWQMVWRG